MIIFWESYSNTSKEDFLKSKNHIPKITKQQSVHNKNETNLFITNIVCFLFINSFQFLTF